LFSNYRPISVLPSFSKNFEKAIYNRLLSFLKTSDIIADTQFGFRKGHSTYMAILKLYDKISASIDKGKFAISVFVDLAKAFDTLDHNILCSKLYHYGVRGIALDLLTNYLTNRSQFTSGYALSSAYNKVIYGVPQGSILGPLLFILYINDIVNCSEVLQLYLFADDTTVFHSDSDFQKLITVLNFELNKLNMWFKANKLSVNVQKTKYILFGFKTAPVSDSYSLMLDSYTLERVNSIKFLGVYIDEKLTWSFHINHVCSKIARGLGILGRLRHIFPLTILSTLYYSLIYPYICYCCILWGGAYSNVLNAVVILQNKAIRLLTNSPYRSSASPLYGQLKMLKVSDVYKNQVLLFMHGVKNTYLPRTCYSFFTVSPSSTHYTRCISYFILKTCRTNVRKKSICIAGPLLWNTIPVELQALHSPLQFKLSLKSLLMKCYGDNLAS
jgi:hypothetical protein